MNIELFFTCTPDYIEGDREEQLAGVEPCGEEYWQTVELKQSAESTYTLYGFTICPDCKVESEIEIKVVPTQRQQLKLPRVVMR